MTEPTQWAMEDTGLHTLIPRGWSHTVLEWQPPLPKHWTARVYRGDESYSGKSAASPSVALALALIERVRQAAYRAGIEEAAKAAEARIPEKSEHQAEEIARDIRALAAPQSGGEEVMAEFHPVQIGDLGRRPVLPSTVTLRAYEVYCELFGEQPAMVTGGCRGGFGAGELIAFLYARSFPKGEWRQRVDEALRRAPESGEDGR